MHRRSHRARLFKPNVAADNLIFNYYGLLVKIGLLHFYSLILIIPVLSRNTNDGNKRLASTVRDLNQTWDDYG